MHTSLTSKRGFNPQHWGPRMWMIIHTIAWTYPTTTKKSSTRNIRRRYRQFFYSLRLVLPCKLCCVNYTHLILGHPHPDKIKGLPRDQLRKCRLTHDSVLDTRSTLTRWTHHIHNSNRIYLKNSTCPFEAARRTYSSKHIRRRIWNEHGFPLLCYVAWHYPISSSRPDVIVAHRHFFNMLSTAIPCDANPVMWTTVNELATLFNRPVQQQQPPLTRDHITRTLVDTYVRAQGRSSATAVRMYADICAHMSRIRQ